MVVGLSMAGRSGDHLPLPQSDLEAGSSLPGEEGECCAAGKHTQAGCTNDLQDGQQIPATSAAKAEWYACPDQEEFASSKASESATTFSSTNNSVSCLSTKIDRRDWWLSLSLD